VEERPPDLVDLGAYVTLIYTMPWPACFGGCRGHSGGDDWQRSVPCPLTALSTSCRATDRVDEAVSRPKERAELYRCERRRLPIKWNLSCRRPILTGEAVDAFSRSRGRHSGRHRNHRSRQAGL